ncbi:MAG TPA: hypothetical protein DEO70_15080 [Bacteroidales bacterium]|nr:MAG: hypothetical protein A2X09_02075 [Bacteroidetes bacterium GWF2_43_11]HBZ68154.1 hypothetical protein [Bacteroidales bacterium]
MLFKKSLPGLTISFIVMVVITVSSNLHWGGDKNWTGIVEADARGYYAYLPAVLIYHDLNFTFVDSLEKVKYKGVHYYEYRTGTPSGRIINKYYSGTAVAQLPFFLAAHALAPIFGYPADGYSKIYMISVNLAAIFYLCIGLIILNSILKKFGVVGTNRSLTMLAIVFGTNLFYYTIGEPGMSHVFSFAFVNLWIWVVLKMFCSEYLRWVVVFGAVTGMIALIRPVNLLVLFMIPFLAGDRGQLTRFLKKLFRSLYILPALTIFILVAGLQLLIYRLSSGGWWVYSYGDEGFNFLSPHIFDFLFSYKKGLFLYTPMAMVCLAGAIMAWRYNQFRLIAYMSFMAILIYVMASWWNWWYGGSFSTRVLTEFLAMLAIPLALWLQNTSGKRRAWLLGVVIFLVVVCQIQTYQYRYMLIHWEEMTCERYWDVFMRVDLLF